MRTLAKLVKAVCFRNGHGSLRFAQAPAESRADARRAGDYASKEWLRQPCEHARKLAGALAVLGDKYALKQGSALRYKRAAFTVPNLAARRSVME
jgi:hypothetical protein